MNSADFSNHMKFECTQNYGSGGEYYLKKLVSELQADPDATIQELREVYAANCRALTPEGVAPEQARIINRFAAVQTAGTLAADFGILPFTEEEIADAIKYVLNLSLTKTTGIVDNDRAVIRLQDFLIRYHAGVPSIRDINVSSTKCFRDPSKNIYIFSDEQFAAASGSSDVVSLAKDLRRRKLLYINENGRLKSKHRLASASDTFVRMYAVKTDILGAELNISDRDTSVSNGSDDDN